MRLLFRLGQDLTRGDVEKLALPGELVPGGPDLWDHLEGLEHEVPRVSRVYAQAELLVWAAATDTKIYASSRELVHHGDPLRHLDWVVVGEHHNSKAQPDPLGQPGQRRDDNLRGG